MFTTIWSFVAAWYNLPFTVVLGLCLMIASLQLVGFSAEHDGDADGELDHDADVDQDADFDQDADLGHDAGLDHDANLEHDADVDQDADMEHEAQVGQDAEQNANDNVPLVAVLSFIGLGKAPLLVVLLILFGTLGISGWLLNGVVQRVFGSYPAPAFALVVPAALLASSVITSRSARLISRALPPISTSATRAQALVGRSGTVISPFVDGEYGQVHLRDASGTLISVFAVSAAENRVRRGDEVVLCSYDGARRRYMVTRRRGNLT